MNPMPSEPADTPTSAAAAPAASDTPSDPVAAPTPAPEPGPPATGGATTPAAAVDPAPPAKTPDLSPAACAAALAQHFPALFGTGVVLPVKLRIQADIQQRVPGVFSRKSLSLFLHRHTTTTAYIRALVAAGQRFDLDGQPAGELSEEHRNAAVEELERRKSIAQERRAAQRRQQAPQPGPDAQPARPPRRAQGPRHEAPRSANRNPRHEPRQAGGAAEHGPRPPRNNGGRPRRSEPAATAAAGPAGAADGQHQAPVPSGEPQADAARRERSALLRAFESSTLTKANFLVLKRMTEAELDAQLALARQERQAPGGGPRDDRPPRR